MLGLKNKIKLVALTLCGFIIIPAHASIGVSPTKIELNANKVKSNYLTTSIDIKGDPKEVMRFKAYAGYFVIDEKSEVVMLDKSDDSHDLSKKIRFVPSEFTVLPSKSQKLRINIPNANSLPDGESRAILYIEDVNPKEFDIDTGRQGIGAQLIVKTRVGIPIYVDKGKFTKVGEIENFSVTQEKDGYYTNMKVLSKGNSRIRYTASVQIIQGKKLIDEYILSTHAVGDNNYFIDKQKLKTDKITTSGDYTVRVVVSYFDANDKKINLKKETNLYIKGNV